MEGNGGIEKPGMGDSGGFVACMRCGKLMPSAALFCNSCGADLKADPSPGEGGAVRPEEFAGAQEAQEARQGEASGGQAPPTPPMPPVAGTAPPPSSTYAFPGPAYQPWAAPPGGGMYPPGAYPHYQYHYPYQPAYPTPLPFRARKLDEMAIISLVCAVASFVIFPFFPAVAAIALGYVSRQRIREAHGSLEGNGLALAGILVGILNVALCLGFLVLILVIAANA